MVRILTRYWCELCGAEHKDQHTAARCEAQGWPEAQLAVGDWVGGWWNIHGWWDARHDLRGVLAMARVEGERHSPPRDRNAWELPREGMGLHPGGGWWWMPLYRVVHVGVRSNEVMCYKSTDTGMPAHMTEYVLWTPFHANGSSEKVVARVDMLHVVQRQEAVPPLDEAQATRFDELVDKLKNSGRGAMPKRLQLVGEWG